MSVNVFSALVDQDEVVKVLTSVVFESKKELKSVVSPNRVAALVGSLFRAIRVAGQVHGDRC